MIDHIILTVSDFERSVAFYAKALKPLGITNFVDYEGHDGHPDLKGFGDGKRAFFWLKEGKPDPQAVHVGFVAKDHAEVDTFYKAALKAGGKSKEAPQTRQSWTGWPCRKRRRSRRTKRTDSRQTRGTIRLKFEKMIRQPNQN